MQQNILGLQISYFFSNTLCIHQRKTGQRHGGEKVLTILMIFFPQLRLPQAPYLRQDVLEEVRH